MTQRQEHWSIEEEGRQTIHQQGAAALLTLLVISAGVYIFCDKVLGRPLGHWLRSFVYQLAKMASKIVAALGGPQNSHGIVMKNLLGLGSSDIVKRVRTLSSANLGLQASNADSDAPPGLRNWDNSCFQNSVLQGLASLPSLSAYLDEVAEGHSALAHTDDSTCGTLHGLMRRLSGKEDNGRSLWTPGKLKSMNTWQQQDAQEYYSKILDELDKEVARASKQRRTVLGLEVVRQNYRKRPASGIEKDDLALDNEKTRDNVSPAQTMAVQNPLEGLLAQRVGCMRCGYSECLSMIPFNCLTLSLGRDWEYDIRDCLNEYTKLEEIEGVECPKCTLLRAEAQIRKLLDMPTTTEAFRTSATKRLDTISQALDNEDFADATLTTKCQIPKKSWTSTTKSKQAVIGRAPKSLVLHVNRSMFDEMTGAQLKNSAHVNFPAKLNLGPWCLGAAAADGNDDGERQEIWSMDPRQSIIPDGSNTTPVMYQIRAIITHYGHHENGHYICYRQHVTRNSPDQLSDKGVQPVQQWWRLSDEDIAPVSVEQVLAHGDVFMLFYERVNTSENQSPVARNGHDIEVVEAEIGETSVATLSLSGNCPEEDGDSKPPAIVRPEEAALPPNARSTPRADDNDETETVSNYKAVQIQSRPVPFPDIPKTSSPLAMRTAGPSHQRDDSVGSLKMAEAF